MFKRALLLRISHYMWVVKEGFIVPIYKLIWNLTENTKSGMSLYISLHPKFLSSKQKDVKNSCGRWSENVCRSAPCIDPQTRFVSLGMHKYLIWSKVKSRYKNSKFRPIFSDHWSKNKRLYVRD
jgi:hypothetical protein